MYRGRPTDDVAGPASAFVDVPALERRSFFDRIILAMIAAARRRLEG